MGNNREISLVELLEMKEGGAKLKKEIHPLVIQGLSDIVSEVRLIKEQQREIMQAQTSAVKLQSDQIVKALKESNVDIESLARLIADQVKPVPKSDYVMEVERDQYGHLQTVTARQKPVH